MIKTNKVEGLYLCRTAVFLSIVYIRLIHCSMFCCASNMRPGILLYACVNVAVCIRRRCGYSAVLINRDVNSMPISAPSLPHHLSFAFWVTLCPSRYSSALRILFCTLFLSILLTCPTHINLYIVQLPDLTAGESSPITMTKKAKYSLQKYLFYLKFF